MIAPTSAKKQFLLGLPYLANGPILKTARALGADVLLSANAFSVGVKKNGYDAWSRFNTSRLSLLDGLTAHLDSAGFSAMRAYGDFPWSVSAYMDLCAAYPWQAFYAMDLCVEPEIASNGTEILNRISRTIANYRACRHAAEDRGIAGRLRPVIQGWMTGDYLRCMDRMGLDDTRPNVIGVGSVCKRPVGGPSGLLAIVDAIDRELGDAPITLHLFGAKGQAAAVLNDHPRVASFDSQAYGYTARAAALRGGFSKTAAFVAETMRAWYLRQQHILAGPTRAIVPTAVTLETSTDTIGVGRAAQRINRRMNVAREEIRELVETGEIDAHWLNDCFVAQWAFED